MVKWWRRKKSDRKQIAVPQKPVQQEVVKSVKTTPSPGLPREPDYASLDKLEPAPASISIPTASLVIIGVGEMGEKVVRQLVSLRKHTEDHIGLDASFLAVRCEQRNRMTDDKEGLDDDKVIHLPLHIEVDFEWYPQNRKIDAIINGYVEKTRGDSRLRLFQDIEQESSALWKSIERCLAPDDEPDVWLVGSASEVEGTGLIFDLAHLIRIVGETQRYHPFIGWMLSLPDEDESTDSSDVTAAFFRELQRLQLKHVPRKYEYDKNSKNTFLHLKEDREGREDVNLVLLCEPPANEKQMGTLISSSELMMDRLALALLTLLQPDVWESFRDDLRHHSGERSDEAVSLLGAYAHHAPVHALQRIVRAKLMEDVLTDQKKRGRRREYSHGIEKNREGARDVLLYARSPSLDIIAKTDGRSTGRIPWPQDEEAERALAYALRHHLQKMTDNETQSEGFASSNALLDGLDELLREAWLPVDLEESLLAVVSNARKSLKQWQKIIRREIKRQMSATILEAEDAWRDSLHRSGWESVLKGDDVDIYYQRLINDDADIRDEIRRYIHWAWVVDGDRVELKLDTLFPEWENNESPWRHSYEKKGFGSLLKGCRWVVEALTREQKYWPTMSVIDEASFPNHEETKRELGLTLGNYMGARQLGFKSGNDEWLKKSWLPKNVTPISTGALDPNWGLLFQVKHQVELTSLRGFSSWQKQYNRRRSRADHLHIDVATQLAAKLEAAVSDRHSGAAPWLGARTVAALQWPDLAIKFVKAWLAGLMQPVSGSGPYYISDPDTTKQLWHAEVDHPLEALCSFTFKGSRSRPGSNEDKRIDALLSNFEFDSGQQNDNLVAIEGWRTAENKQDVEWGILVNGLISLNFLRER